jgi:glycosyltransferase involved in cell wall biosynthesis
MKKKVVFVVLNLNVGGAQKFLISLVNSLPGDIFELTIISLSDSNPLKDELNNNILFAVLARSRKVDIKALYTFAHILRKKSPDIVFCLNAYPFFFLKISTLFFDRYKKIISYHTTIPLNKKQDKLHKLYFSLLGKRDLIITVSENQAIYTEKKYNVAAKYFRTIHNGIDISRWTLPSTEFSRSYFREQFGFSPDDKIIVMSAVLRPEKNHLGAIRALKIMHDVYHLKAHLLIVGGGQMMDILKNLTAILELKEYIKFAGEQKDVRPFYWISDLFTLTSEMVETFSIAALEAMACGLPVVLTDIGGASEMVSVGKNGFLCSGDYNDISEKWLLALTSEFDKEKISSDIFSRFNHADMVKKYFEVFNKI